MKTCKICAAPTVRAFEAVVRNRHRAEFFRCGDCGFLQPGDPVWLPEAYREPINAEDTGILSRNLYLAGVVSSVLFALFGRNARSLDYGGGHGILTRLLRDIGFDSYWCDPHAQNLFARGFEYGDATGRIDLVTCFEAFEHFADPVPEIGKILGISRNVLFTTVLLPDPVPAPGDWWYYGLSHGQHVSFYTVETLRRVAQAHDLRFLTNRCNVHMFTEKGTGQGTSRALLGLNRLGLPRIVRALMKSRTLRDMEALSRRRE